MARESIHLVGGIRTWSGKYWNCEKFGFQLSANAAVLKSKQTFSLEPTDDGKWVIKSWLGKYLTAEELGTVTCKADEVGEKEKFTFEFLKGLVAIKSNTGKYVSADENNITTKPTLGERELFDIVLSIHPMVVLKSFEGRFVRLDDANGVDAICNSNLQFGPSTLVTLEYENNGKYTVKTTTGKYWSVDDAGVVKATATSKGEKELFWFELIGKKVALRSTNGNYVTPDGQKGNLKTKGDKITNRELWDLLPADPQVSLQAGNGKYVSAQGRDVLCNRPHVSADETFALEWVRDNVYAVRTTAGKYWTMKEGVLHVESDQRTASEEFAVGFQDGKIYFKSQDKYYLSAKAVGGLKGVAASEPSENELFTHELLARPAIQFRAKQMGFVGLNGDKISAAKTTPDTFSFEFKDGKYLLRSASGDFLAIGAGDSINVSPRNQTPLQIEFTNGKIAFKTTDGEYLISDDQGNFIIGSSGSSAPAEAQFDF